MSKSDHTGRRRIQNAGPETRESLSTEMASTCSHFTEKIRIKRVQSLWGWMGEVNCKKSYTFIREIWKYILWNTIPIENPNMTSISDLFLFLLDSQPARFIFEWCQLEAKHYTNGQFSAHWHRFSSTTINVKALLLLTSVDHFPGMYIQ